MSFKRKLLCSVSPRSHVRKSRISSAPPPPLDLLIIFTTPPPPNTRYNVTIEDENLKTVFAICCPTTLLEGFSERPKPHDDSNIRPCKREANRILDKLHATTEI